MLCDNDIRHGIEWHNQSKASDSKSNITSKFSIICTSTLEAKSFGNTLKHLYGQLTWIRFPFGGVSLINEYPLHILTLQFLIVNWPNPWTWRWVGTLVWANGKIPPAYGEWTRTHRKYENKTEQFNFDQFNYFILPVNNKLCFLKCNHTDWRQDIN